jgi:hypothetical protein
MIVSGSFTTSIRGVRHLRAGTKTQHSSSLPEVNEKFELTRYAGGL